MELHWAWYALALVGVYRMIAVCFEAVVRRTVHIARQSAAESKTRPERSATQSNGAPFERGLPPGTAPGEGWGQL
ncbi:hypothetical protein ACF06X_34310 [Streptomyces sp. NPDC015346]|uniref:hypothetical protein n=1 Tax=Streptomyces sp. NPDC015346 TaxID=3364954 RepID=UPI0036FC3B61